jgi:glycosyltransferase involved in cell wall biosynthesis
MRVLLFRMLCDTGGVSSSMLLLGRHLERRGIDVEYWFCRPSSRLPDFLATGRATVGSLAALAARFERGEYDVVHMTASDPAALVVSRIASAHARVVVTSRGALSDVWDHGNCFAFTAISEGMATVNQPFTELEIEVVRNAIDVEAYSAPADREAGAPIVAFVGRTTAVEKDFPRFTRIARRLVERGARVWIADPHEGTWDKFEGLPVERIPTERWERVAHESMADFYRAVASSNGVVLMTSRTEGFGNVAPEAAACGARVAAPDVMGLRDAIVDGETGMLYPVTASDEEVAERIQRWCDEPHDMTRCAESARQAFSPSAMVDRYLAIYRRRAQLLRHTTGEIPHRTSDDSAMGVLLEHLSKQRRWRAKVARQAADELARAGYRRLALSVIGDGLRASATQFLRAAGLRDLASTGVRLARAERRS